MKFFNKNIKINKWKSNKIPIHFSKEKKVTNVTKDSIFLLLYVYN